MNPRRTRIEKALNDGNCAFNAFALGLAEKDMLNAIERDFLTSKPPPMRFISAVAEKLGITPNWFAVKAKLLSLKKEKTLQTFLAPILRSLAIELIRMNADTHRENRTDALLADFDNVFSSIFLHKPLERDDIYDLPFITGKYKELISDIISTQKISASTEERKIFLQDAVKGCQEKLKQWWNADGFKLFLEEMSKDGAWVGDLELVPLFEYFGINFYVKAPRFGSNPITLYTDHGSFLARESKLEEACIQQLIGRNIIEAPNLSAEQMIEENSRLKWKSMTETELDLSLSDLDLIQGDMSFANKTLMDQAKQRGIMAQRQGQWILTLDSTKTQERIGPCPQRNTVLSLWKATYRKAPAMVLENKHASHWNYVMRKEESVSSKGMFKRHNIPTLPDTRTRKKTCRPI